MIFLVQFGINKHLFISSKPQIAQIFLKTNKIAQIAILLVFKKIYSSLFIPNCARNHVITNKNCTPLSSITIINHNHYNFLQYNWCIRSIIFH